MKSYQKAKRIEELIEKVADDAAQPPHHPIPKQRLPAIFRWSVRIIAWPFIQLDHLAERLATKLVPPPFKRGGACKKRGNCCHYILLPKPTSFLSRLYYLWNIEVNGFYRLNEPEYHDEEEDCTWLVMGCRYFKNNLCSVYRFRPQMCRKWPIVEIFGPPRILKGCGYQALIKKPQKPSSKTSKSISSESSSSGHPKLKLLDD